MPDAKIDTEVIDGQSFDIFVTSSGAFFSNWGDEDERISAPTKKELVTKLRRAVKAHRKVAVAATLLNESSWRHDRWELKTITLTGINGRTNNVMYKQAGQRGGEQLSSHDMVLKSLTKDEVTELKQLWAARTAAIKAYERYRDALKINPEKLVEAEVEKVVGA